MATTNKLRSSPSFIFLSLALLFHFYLCKGDLLLNYYSESCPNAEDIIKQEVTDLYNEHGNTAVSWVRNLFHDCMVKSCDASLLLETVNGIESEQASERSFGMRNFKYVSTIKEALEKKCPLTLGGPRIEMKTGRRDSKESYGNFVEESLPNHNDSITLVLSRFQSIGLDVEGIVALLGGPRIEMKTGRRDSKESYANFVEESLPNHNDSITLVLSRFQSIGLDVEGIVALLGAHSVGRTHCTNLVHRLYPTVDPTLDPQYAEYLKGRCPTPNPDPKAVLYARNDRETPMILDNMYYKNLLGHKGLLIVDQQLTSDPTTYPYVEKFAADNGYFQDQFAKAVLLLSENNPLTGADGEIRKDCRYANSI
ncbi:peroxidase 21 [Quercus suber]|uniref:Peroxidase n=1 Tax=Quercus suber TaxID=58331 RepID=A0AAW0LQP6_QUESU